MISHPVQLLHQPLWGGGVACTGPGKFRLWRRPGEVLQRGSPADWPGDYQERGENGGAVTGRVCLEAQERWHTRPLPTGDTSCQWLTQKQPHRLAAFANYKMSLQMRITPLCDR